MKRTFVIQIEADDHADMIEQFARVAKAIVVDGAVAGQLLNKETLKQTGIFSAITHKNVEGVRIEALLAMTAMTGPLIDAMKDADLKMSDDDKPKDDISKTTDELAALKVLTEALTKARGSHELSHPRHRAARAKRHAGSIR